MSKKNAIILIMVIFLGSLGALIWFYFNGTNTNRVAIQDPVGNVYDPFGTINTPTNTIPPSENNSKSTSTIQENRNRLRQVSLEPVSGYTLTNQSTKPVVRYVLRANGNIYETLTDQIESRRLSNTTIPRVYESNWLPDGNNLVLRYLKEDNQTIVSFSVKINPATSTVNEFEGGIDGSFLTENISTLSINPKGDKIFTGVPSLNGLSAYISNTKGLNKKIIFESPLIEWISSWPKEDTITLNTKASGLAAGYLYFLNSQTGDLTKILGGITGLTSKINTGATEVLYSDSSRGLPKLYLFNVKKKESKLLPWNTLPEKCVWGELNPKIIYCAVPKSYEKGTYPDQWYQGLTNFNDSIWSFNTETGASSEIYNLETSGQKIDVINPIISKNDSNLFFTDKTTLTLWQLNLK